VRQVGHLQVAGKFLGNLCLSFRENIFVFSS